MPGSRRTFAYTLKPSAEDAPRTLRQVEKILAWACAGDDRIECHGVSGEALGAITMNLTVIGRDQWACRQTAQDILNYVTWTLKNPADMDLRSERQEPHENRGYDRGGRTKRFRQPRPRQPQSVPDPGPPAEGP